MPTINQLSAVSTLSPGDLIAVYTQNNGDARKTSINNLLQYFQQSFASPEFATQYITPGTGASVPITNNGNNTWCLVAPAGTIADLTLTLPLNTGLADGQMVLVTSTQIITTLTIGLNGATAANGAPTTMAANAFFTLRFYTSTNSWYRVA